MKRTSAAAADTERNIAIKGDTWRALVQLRIDRQERSPNGVIRRVRKEAGLLIRTRRMSDG